MTRADLDLVGQRLSESTRQTLQATATEFTAGSYKVELTEERARDLASKAANLGLVEIASRVPQELTGPDHSGPQGMSSSRLSCVCLGFGLKSSRRYCCADKVIEYRARAGDALDRQLATS